MEERHLCLIHCEDDGGTLTNFTPTSFKRFLECRKQWLQLDGRQKDVALKTTNVIPIEELEDNLGSYERYFYHSSCYSAFANKTLIHRAQRRSEKSAKTSTDTEPSTSVQQEGPSPEKIMLRSKSFTVERIKAKSQHVLPPTCVICKKEHSYYTDRVGKRSCKSRTGGTRVGSCMELGAEVVFCNSTFEFG